MMLFQHVTFFTMPAQLMKGVSVIICCYNSILKLPATLAHLAKQSYKPSWEIILVDNNSSDRTAQFAKQFWYASGLVAVPLVSVTEKRPGLSYAREAGIEAARYEFIIFCDDDNWLAENYIEKAYEIISADSRIGILGGFNSPVSDSNFPNWFLEMQNAYACGPQAATDGEVDRQFITGAGMVVRKKIFLILKSLGYKSLLTGRKGQNLLSGDDSEICFVTIMLKYKIIYSAELALQHYMPQIRLTWPYFIKMILGHAQAGYILQYYQLENSRSDYRDNWLSELIRISVIYLRQTSSRMVCDYFVCKNRISSSSEVGNLMDTEKWLTHFKNFGSYSSLIKSIKQIKTATSEYVKNSAVDDRE